MEENKPRRIIFWNQGERQFVKRRSADIGRFWHKGIKYIFFKNNLKETYSLLGQCDGINKKNYLLAYEPLKNIKTVSTALIVEKLEGFVKNRKFGKTEFKNYLGIK